MDALDELVSSTSSESLFLAQSSSLVSLHSAQSAAGTQVMLCWVSVLHPFWLTVHAPSGSAGGGDPTLPLVSLAVAALCEKGCFPQRVVFFTCLSFFNIQIFLQFLRINAPLLI